VRGNSEATTKDGVILASKAFADYPDRLFLSLWLCFRAERQGFALIAI
jgi:hypothetical protein